VQGARGLGDPEVLREWAVPQPLDDRTRIDRDWFIVSPARRISPARRSSRTRCGKNSSSQSWISGISPDQNTERPPRFSCGFSPIQNSVLELPLC
jgi:hypothetical protein